MELTINHVKKEFIALPVSLEELVMGETLGKIKGIAVALNNTVIRRDNWQSTCLSNQDTIIIVSATQGG